MTLVMFTSCERVAPNYAGVLMENYGKQGKEDFKIVSGKVSTWELGTELFQVHYSINVENSLKLSH